MDSLPTEILIEIFKQLTDKDLLVLTLVCSLFNEIISNSRELSSQLKLHFKNNQQSSAQEILTSEKKFSTLIIESFNPMPHLRVHNALAEHIQRIEIHRWNWSLDCKFLHQILDNLPQLRHVRFSKILFHLGTQFSYSVGKLTSLDALEVIESDSRIFRLFKHTQVRKLVYDYVPSGGIFPIPDMIKFVHRQERLEELTLSGFVAFITAGIGRIIFHNDKLSSVKFRLRKLTMKNSPILQTVHLRDFLSLHAKTLTTVDLDGLEYWNCAEFINSCEMLEVLRISKRHRSFDFGKVAGNERVRVLDITGPVDKAFLGRFPNVKVLKVANLRTERRRFDEELACNQVEAMTVEKTYLGGFFKFPKLRKLHLRNVRVADEEIFRVNPSISEVIFENCDSELVGRLNLSNEKFRVTILKT